MCAILDANAAGRVFANRAAKAKNKSASERFFDWIDSGAGNLVAGGKLLSELDEFSKFRKWRKRAAAFGRITILNENNVNEKTEQIKSHCKSDDPHIIAVALIGKARLLYSNDGDLQEDFGDSNLVNNPRGKVYSTRRGDVFTSDHRRLLNQSPCKRDR